MKKISFLTLFLIFGCGKQVVDINFDSVKDPSIEIYVNEFIEIAQQCFDRQAHYSSFSYGFNELEEIRKKKESKDTVGVCLMMPSSRKAMMAIRYSSWAQMPNETRKILVFHEMMHCYGGQREHVDGHDHIMNPYLSIGPKTFRDNFQRYVEDLFGKETHCDLQYEDRELPEGSEMNPLHIKVM